MMEILFGNFEKDFLFFRNWISVHLQNHLSSIYMRFYQLKQPELVLLDKNWIESLWSTSFSSSHKKKYQENLYDLQHLLYCRTVTRFVVFLLALPYTHNLSFLRYLYFFFINAKSKHYFFVYCFFLINAKKCMNQQ